MVRLTTVPSSFEARVLAARLGADGFVTSLRGNVDGPYPGVGSVQVFVEEDALAEASSLLLADEVESAFEPAFAGGPSVVHRHARWIVAGAVVLTAAASIARVG